jgi:hypothetical protein
MRVLRIISVSTIVTILGFALWSSLALAAAIDLTEIEFEYDGSPWALGWKFSVSVPTSVETLGVYDSDQDGLSGTAQVGLWLETGGDPIVKATVPSRTAGALDGHFRFAPITPTPLIPGTEYIVGSYLSGELATALFSVNGIVDSRVNVIDVRYSDNRGFGFPGLTDPGSDGAAFLGSNFQLTPAPLPAAAWPFGSGVVGLSAWARRRMSV